MPHRYIFRLSRLKLSFLFNFKLYLDDQPNLVRWSPLNTA